MILDLPPKKRNDTMFFSGKIFQKQQQLSASWVFPETEKNIDPDSQVIHLPRHALKRIREKPCVEGPVDLCRSSLRVLAPLLGSTLQNKQNWIWSRYVHVSMKATGVSTGCFLILRHHPPLPNHLGTRIYLKKTLGGFTLQCQACRRKGLQKTQVSLVQLVRTNDFFFFA